MKILSIRRGFQADHSSTSYEFFALDKPLDQSQREKVAKLSSRARPTKRKVSFIYHGDWNDLPGGYKPLMEKYYDVMYSESYDWWTLSMAFNADPKTIEEIKKYESSGTDDMGVDMGLQKDRVVVTIHCRLSPGFGCLDEYSDSYDEEDEDEEAAQPEDSLLNLLVENRKCLKKGDYRLLYGVWQKYGEGESPPPEPPKMDKLPRPTKYLLSLLERT
ncbi:MAG: hypothetical protein HY747_01515 [Elusimicrobia bacterium]|nr:hypothetical protein [Elusimicrobiota bacterium]